MIQRAGFSLALVFLTATLLILDGRVGRIAVGTAATKDAALVWSLVWHVVLGVLITSFHCALALVAGRLLTSDSRLAAHRALLVGFPASLVLLALVLVVALSGPAGRIAVLGLGAVLLLALKRDLGTVSRWRSMLAAHAPTVLAAAAFGLWLGLLWHGPTATLPGWPAGDQVYYTTLVTSLADNPWSLRNLGNEGEKFYPFNLLWPAIGAALSHGIEVEPFAFIAASGGTAFVLTTAILLRAYAKAVEDMPERSEQRFGAADAWLIGLGLLVAGRYPFWVVESPPMIHTLALSIAVWYWATRMRSTVRNSVLGTASALLGALLTKVVGAATLVPLALSSMVSRDVRGARAASWPLIGTLAGVGLLGAWLLATFAPRLLAVGGLGPEGFVWLVKWRSGWRASTPYVLRDIGTLVLALASFSLLRTWQAIAVSFGLASALVLPFAFRAAWVAAVFVLALATSESANRSLLNRGQVAAGLLLCLPAMLLTDPGGHLTGLVWAICIMVAVWTAVSPVLRAREQGRSANSRLGWYTCTTASVGIGCFLLAVARGHVGISSNWVGGKHTLTPELRQVWQAVPDLVPPRALVFTDQTGDDWGLLTGWNTYAFHGKRQLYISTWVQSAELQTDARKRAQKLAWNALVLSGSLPPTDVPLREKYEGFYAVVDLARIQLLPAWTVLRTVGPYALMRWDGAIGAAVSQMP